MSARRWVIALLVLVSPIDAVARDPRVPPGRDPGGIAVALVSTGIDYTSPQIAERLARDGEGEVIGWDFKDGDATPFEPGREQLPAGQGFSGTAVARMVLAEAPGARLVPVRIEAEQPASLARALAFVGQTPTQVVLLAGGASAREHWETIHDSARHLMRLLIIMPLADRRGITEAVADNVLTVAASSAVDAEMVIEPISSAALPPATAAAARVAGRAAKLAARTSGLDGASLKQAVLQQHAR